MVDAQKQTDKRRAIAERLRSEKERRRRDESAAAERRVQEEEDQRQKEETTALQKRIREIEDMRLQAEQTKVRQATIKHASISAVIGVVVCSVFLYLSHREVLRLSPDAQLRRIVDRTTNQLKRHFASNGLGLVRHDGWTVNVENERDFRKRSESPFIATLQYRFAAIDDMKPDENGRSSYRTKSCSFAYRYSRRQRRWICVAGGYPIGMRNRLQRRYQFYRNKETGYWFFYDSRNPDAQPPTG